MLILLGSFVGATLFVVMVHYIVRPFVFAMYEYYEPILFHYKFKITHKFRGILKKFRKSSLN